MNGYQIQGITSEERRSIREGEAVFNEEQLKLLIT